MRWTSPGSRIAHIGTGRGPHALTIPPCRHGELPPLLLMVAPSSAEATRPACVLTRMACVIATHLWDVTSVGGMVTPQARDVCSAACGVATHRHDVPFTVCEVTTRRRAVTFLRSGATTHGPNVTSMVCVATSPPCVVATPSRRCSAQPPTVRIDPWPRTSAHPAPRKVCRVSASRVPGAAAGNPA